MGLLKLGQYAKSLTREGAVPDRQAASRSPRPTCSNDWFEFDPLKGTKSASGIIGTFLGPAFAGHGVRAAAPLHGRDRRRVPRLGLRQERQRRRDRRRSRSSARALGVEIRTSAAGAAGHRARAAAPRASRWRTATNCTPRSCMSAADPKRSFLQFVEEQALARTSSSQQIRNFRVRGSSGKVNIALSELPRVHLPARRRPAAPRRDLDQPEHRIHRTRLRRSQVRPVLEATRTST